jgi:hypothetical protein
LIEAFNDFMNKIIRVITRIVKRPAPAGKGTVSGDLHAVTQLGNNQPQGAAMIRSIRRFTAAAVVVGAVAGAATYAPALRAQFSQTDLNNPEVMHLALDQQVGKRVRVKLIAGGDLEGTVSRVGRSAVFLTDLAGMEFYDATVRVEQIAAVIVRRAR